MATTNHADSVRRAHLGESEAGITKRRRDSHVRLIALEEAFWYDKLATDVREEVRR
jgi:hypothetical protein